jgi:hypothetical protein
MRVERDGRSSALNATCNAISRFCSVLFRRGNRSKARTQAELCCSAFEKAAVSRLRLTGRVTPAAMRRSCAHGPTRHDSRAERLATITLIVCQLPAAASTFATVFNASCQWPAAASTLATSFNAVRTISSSSFASRRCVSSDACDWHACRCSSASSSAVLHSSDPKAF